MKTAFDKVSAARAKGRATAINYIEGIFEDFMEMHGDRRFGDDRAVIAGVAALNGVPVTVIGIEKGKTVRERALRNSGSVHPEGYRKALRQMRQAEKFGRAVVCFVDTPGAYCGVGAEERGQGQAIAENLTAMMGLGVPIISVVISEGGSGGALALAVADEVWMMENAIYSVISPEGCASILWKDAGRAAEASECLKLTAADLLQMGVIERIVPEFAKPGADGADTRKFAFLKGALAAALQKHTQLSNPERLGQRYDRFRKLGAPN